MSEPEPAVCLRNLHFAYTGDAQDFQLLIDHFEVPRGANVALVGPSGAGKSTLLGLICGVLQPDRGSVEVLGNHLDQMTDRQRDRFRADNLGIIFQQFNLLPYLPAIENVLLALEFSRHKRLPSDEKRAMAEKLLESLDIDVGSLGRQKSAQLSVGQQQRVAAARAFVAEPKLIVADEPTSALDADRRTEFVDLLFEQSARTGATLIMVTHDASLAKQFDRTVKLQDILTSSVSQESVG